MGTNRGRKRNQEKPGEGYEIKGKFACKLRLCSRGTLVVADPSKQLKHRTYDAECAKHGWKMTPFVLETYGAKGKAAQQLLQRMAPHSIDRSPVEFLAHAERVLSVALQTGNAGVTSQGTAGLYLQKYRRGCGGLLLGSPSRRQRRRATVEQRAAHHAGADPYRLGHFAHGGMHAARIGCGSRRGMLADQFAA